MALSDEDKNEVGELIKAAFGGDDLSKLIGKQVEATVGKAVKGLKLEESISEAVGKAVEGLKPEPPDPDDKKSDTGDESPALKKLQSELEKMQRQAQEQSEKARLAEAARQRELLRNGVRDGLVTNGADSKRLAVALNHLEATGLLKLDDKGQPCFVFQRDWGEELVPAADGAKQWLETDEGKIFLPPTGVQGTGDKAGSLAHKGGQTASAEAIALQALGSTIR